MFSLSLTFPLQVTLRDPGVGFCCPRITVSGGVGEAGEGGAGALGAGGAGGAGGVELFVAHALHDISNKENMNKAIKMFMFDGWRTWCWVLLFTDITERRADSQAPAGARRRPDHHTLRHLCASLT